LTIFIDLAIVNILKGSGETASHFVTDFHFFKFIKLIRKDKNKTNRKENVLILTAYVFFGLLTAVLLICAFNI
jgi:hypothetical protein